MGDGAAVTAGKAADNSVILVGGSLSGAAIYGGHAATSTGNTLVVGTKGLTVKTVSDFQKYCFDLAEAAADDTMLTIGDGTVALSGTDYLTINPGALAKDEKVVLFAGTEAISYAVPESNLTISRGANTYSGTVSVLGGDTTKLVFTMGETTKYVELMPGTVSDNEVVLTSGTEATVNTAAVTFNNGGEVSLTQWQNAYGGYSTTLGAVVSGNTITVTAGGAAMAATGSVYGGYSQSGTAEDNAVLVQGNGETAFSAQGLYGGYGLEAANDNKVTLGAATAAANISGLKSIYGGYGAVSATAAGAVELLNNQVEFINGTVVGASDSGLDIYGGYVSENSEVFINSGVAEGNSVKFAEVVGASISLSNVNQLYGAYLKTNEARAQDNKVMIASGQLTGWSTTDGENALDIAGARNDSAAVPGQYDEANQVEITGGILSNVSRITGVLTNGSASKNEVSLTGGTMNGIGAGMAVYGAYLTNKSAQSSSALLAAEENLVTISGEDTSLNTVITIAGAYTDKANPYMSDNKVVLESGSIKGRNEGMTVYGAYSGNAANCSLPAENNSVVLKSDAEGKTVSLEQVVEVAAVRGNKVYENTLKGNQVAISAGSITGLSNGVSIYGAVVNEAYCSSLNENMVIIEQDTQGATPVLNLVANISAANINYEGSGESNKILISAGKITGIEAGMSLAGIAITYYADYSNSQFMGNSVEITASEEVVPNLDKVGNIYGAKIYYGTGTDNKVLINAGTIKGVSGGMVISGLYDSYGYGYGLQTVHTGNSVEITALSASIVPTLQNISSLTGAYGQCFSALKSNKVLITAGSIGGSASGMLVAGANEYYTSYDYSTVWELTDNMVEIRQDATGVVPTLSNITVLAGAYGDYGNKESFQNNKVLIAAGYITGLESTGLAVLGAGTGNVYYSYGLQFAENRIEISGGELKNVNSLMGAHLQEGYGAPSSNSNMVLITAGKVSGLTSGGMTIYGSKVDSYGYSYFGGTQEGNTVQITGSNTDTVLEKVAQIAGAVIEWPYLVSGFVGDNKVLIVAGDIQGITTGMTLYGAFGKMGPGSSYYGAGEFAGNSLEITGGLLSEVVRLAGVNSEGNEDAGTSSKDNILAVTSGSITGLEGTGMSLYGANAYYESVTNGNMAKISGEAELNGVVKIAGASVKRSGTANDNKVLIAGGHIKGTDIEIYGAELTKSYFSSSQYEGNAVEITGGKLENVRTIMGFYLESANSAGGDAYESGVWITDGTVAGVAEGMSVYGANNQVTAAKDSEVVITGGVVTNIKDVYGGYGLTGAEGNKVTLAVGEYSGSVYGGSSESGTVKENVVNIGAVAVAGSIYGGYSANGTVEDNIVNLRVEGDLAANVYAGKSDGGTVTNNTLNWYSGTLQGGEIQGNTINILGAEAAYTGSAGSLEADGAVSVAGRLTVGNGTDASRLTFASGINVGAEGTLAIANNAQVILQGDSTFSGTLNLAAAVAEPAANGGVLTNEGNLTIDSSSWNGAVDYGGTVNLQLADYTQITSYDQAGGTINIAAGIITNDDDTGELNTGSRAAGTKLTLQDGGTYKTLARYVFSEGDTTAVNAGTLVDTKFNLVGGVVELTDSNYSYEYLKSAKDVISNSGSATVLQMDGTLNGDLNTQKASDLGQQVALPTATVKGTAVNTIIGTDTADLVEVDGIGVMADKSANGFNANRMDLALNSQGLVITDDKTLFLGGNGDSGRGNLITVAGQDTKVNVVVGLAGDTPLAGASATNGTLGIGIKNSLNENGYRLNADVTVNKNSTLEVNGDTEIVGEMDMTLAELLTGDNVQLKVATLELDDSNLQVGKDSEVQTENLKIGSAGETLKETKIAGTVKVTETLTVSKSEINDEPVTVSVGTEDNKGTLVAKNIVLNGGMVFTDPAWAPGVGVEGASQVVTETTVLDGTYVAGQNSLLTFGTLDDTKAATIFSNSSMTWGAQGVTAGAYLAKSLDVSGGALIVDGSLTTKPGDVSTNGTVTFAGQSLLMVDGTSCTTAPIITGVTALTVAATSKLYIANGVAGEKYQIVKGDTTVAWQEGNVLSNVTTQVASVDEENGIYTVTLGESTYHFEDTMLPETADAMNGAAQGSAAKDFMQKLVDYGTVVSHSGMVDSINALGNMSLVAGVSHTQYTVANITEDSVNRHLSIQNPTEGRAIWAEAVHLKEEVDGLGFGGVNYKGQYNGAVVGMDFINSGKTSFGAALTYVEGKNNGSYTLRNETEHVGLSLYGRSLLPDDAALAYDISYLHGTNDLGMIVPAAGDTKITGDQKVNSFAMGARYEKKLRLSRNTEILPYGGMRWLYMENRAFTNSLGMHYDSSSGSAVIVPVGISLKASMENSGWKMSLKGDLGYQWNFGNKDISQKVSFGEAGNTLQGAFADDHNWYAGVGTEFARKNFTATIGTKYMKGSSTKQNKWFGQLSWSF